MSSAHRFGFYKSVAVPRLAVNHGYKIAASSEDSLLIGQFLVCPATSQPIRRDKVDALVRDRDARIGTTRHITHKCTAFLKSI